MSRYKVKIYYSTFCEVEVEAGSREEAVDAAYGKVGSDGCKKQLIDNLQRCDDEDAELLDDGEDESEAMSKKRFVDEAYNSMVGIKDKWDVLGKPNDIGENLYHVCILVIFNAMCDLNKYQDGAYAFVMPEPLPVEYVDGGVICVTAVSWDMSDGDLFIETTAGVISHSDIKLEWLFKVAQELYNVAK